MNTTLNDVIHWWGYRPIAEVYCLSIFFVIAAVAAWKVLEYSIRASERKRIARLLADPVVLSHALARSTEHHLKTRR